MFMSMLVGRYFSILDVVFFFQAEDGIRDTSVTGVQTCALPILTQYSKPGNTLGHGIGADIGVAWVSGPIEIGFGVNDIGATITWPDTRLDSAFYNDSGYSKPVANHVETKTKLPVSYIANLAYSVGNTTLGADVLNTGRGSVVHVGGEQRLGLFAVRGGVARDQRKRDR